MVKHVCSNYKIVFKEHIGEHYYSFSQILIRSHKTILFKIKTKPGMNSLVEPPINANAPEIHLRPFELQFTQVRRLLGNAFMGCPCDAIGLLLLQNAGAAAQNLQNEFMIIHS